uniref:Uncharacterized protein n=1 Tax=Octopus bimaculoides TaxID=37653 RepID=A0A0L8I6I6_OCTBM
MYVDFQSLLLVIVWSFNHLPESAPFNAYIQDLIKWRVGKSQPKREIGRYVVVISNYLV